jgi:hypothetical protein
MDVPLTVAQLAAGLNDTSSTIGDPRKMRYSVSFVTPDFDLTAKYESTLTALEIPFKTNYKTDAEGNRTLALVTVYDAHGQKQLFDLVHNELVSERREALSDLVLARGSVPAEYITWIRHYRREGETWDQVADRLNASGLIAGMGGKRWTAKKVRSAASSIV